MQESTFEKDVDGLQRTAAPPARLLVGAMLGAIAALALAAPAIAADPEDRDGDRIANSADNCFVVSNPNQIDADQDEIGDACDRCLGTKADVPTGLGTARLAVDPFGCSLSQLCPCLGPREKLRAWRTRKHYLRCIKRRTERLRRLRAISGRERSAMIAQSVASGCGFNHGRPGDADGDGIPDDGNKNGLFGDLPCHAKARIGCDDNCPRIRNRKQGDFDRDGRGNVCDRDYDGDGVRNSRDNCPRIANTHQEDGDKDGVGDVCDDCKETEEGDDVDSKGCD